MIQTIIAALLPIVVTLCLGFFAGWHKDFDIKQGSTLNKMVMLYALPLTLFAGMLGIERSVLLEQGSMASLIFIGMVVSYLIVLFLSYFIFKKSLKVSALLALAIAGPAVPFVGVPVLGFLYGDLSTVPIALCSIIMNLIQVPITLFILSQDDNTSNSSNNVIQNLKETIKEPVIWAPICAFILLIIGIPIPKDISQSLLLLGHATGGVALFASGVILYSYHIKFDLTIALSVLIKNLVIPGLVLLGGIWYGISPQTLNISVISLAIPTASICVILAVQYKTAEQEMSSILFFSTIFSIITMGSFLAYLH
jgi:malonate transporter and related proteins